LNFIKKKLEKNPTLKMRMTHSSVEEEEWSSQQAVCCHLGPHKEEAKEESNHDSQPDEGEDED
jgi:DNA-directed RNA polymerase specialized sigma54-like protein